MNELGFDAGLHVAARRRAWRRWILLLGVLVAFVSTLGLPHLRLTYKGGKDRITEGSYWSVTGMRRVAAGQHAQGCPLIVIVPLEEPLWVSATGALKSLWREG